jgi:hypothetical protein
MTCSKPYIVSFLLCVRSDAELVLYRVRQPHARRPSLKHSAASSTRPANTRGGTGGMARLKTLITHGTFTSRYVARLICARTVIDSAYRSSRRSRSSCLSLRRSTCSTCRPSCSRRATSSLPFRVCGFVSICPRWSIAYASLLGTYQSGKPVIKIASFAPKLTVISSKQRPRRLSLKGSDGKDYQYVLKGTCLIYLLCVSSYETDR